MKLQYFLNFKVMLFIDQSILHLESKSWVQPSLDKSNPWVEDDDSAEEAEIETVVSKKTEEERAMLEDNEDEDPLDAYMSSLKNSLVGKSGNCYNRWVIL